MTNGDDTLPIADPSEIDADLLGEVYDQLVGDELPTIDDWKARDVENSPVAWMNKFLNGGPLEDFDRFILLQIMGWEQLGTAERYISRSGQHTAQELRKLNSL